MHATLASIILLPFALVQADVIPLSKLSNPANDVTFLNGTANWPKLVVSQIAVFHSIRCEWIIQFGPSPLNSIALLT